MHKIFGHNPKGKGSYLISTDQAPCCQMGLFFDFDVRGKARLYFFVI
jgi:hypothetical protein